MIRNSNLSVLPFYATMEEQDFRKFYAYKDGYGLLVDKDHLIPFFYAVPHQDNANVTFRLVKGTTMDDFLSGNTTKTTIDLGDGVSMLQSPTTDIVIFDGISNTALGLEKGLYYLEMRYNLGAIAQAVYYSDLFCVADTTDCIKIEWYCFTDIEFDGGVIPYNRGFVNRFFLDSEIAMPTYTFNEEGEERDGVFFASKQVSQKVFHFNFLATEYLCDCLRTIRLSDVIKITDQLGREYKCNSFLMDCNWLEQGYLAEVAVEFETDTIVKRCGGAIEHFSTSESSLTFGVVGQKKSIVVYGSRLFSFAFASSLMRSSFSAKRISNAEIEVECVSNLFPTDTIIITSEQGEEIKVDLSLLI